MGFPPNPIESYSCVGTNLATLYVVKGDSYNVEFEGQTPWKSLTQRSPLVGWHIVFLN